MTTEFYVFEVPEDQADILSIMGPYKIASYSDDGVYMMVTMSSDEIDAYSDYEIIEHFKVFSDFESWSYTHGWVEPTGI